MMNTYEITVKLSKRGKKHSWLRFAKNDEEARRSAERAIEQETFGEGAVLSVRNVGAFIGGDFCEIH